MILLLLNIILSPWTKVEESFNVQAIHDFIFHTGDLNLWDHHSFPGVVPRTFTGALVLYILGSPIYMLFGALNLKKVWYLIAARAVLAILTWSSSYGFYSTEFLMMEFSSFHMNFWGSRPIPNTFANILTNFAFLFQSRGGPRNGLTCLALFVFTAVVFRAEVAMLGAFVILSDLYHREYRLDDAIKVFILTFTSSLLWTVSLDSYLWKQPFYWPELKVFLFNTWNDGSKAYGTMPWDTYFTQMLPKIAPLAYPLSIMALCTKYSDHKRSLIPVFTYVFIYSFLPHKEWRFIMYVITPLQVSASRFLQSCTKSTTHIFLMMGGILFGLSAVAMGISSLNYPGGVALDHVPHKGAIYIDTFTAMSGASRFGQALPCKPWPFSQNCGLSEISTSILINRSKICYPTTSLLLADLNQTCIPHEETADMGISSETRSVLYDKNETQTQFSSYSYILTHEPQKYSTRRVLNVIYGYGGIGYRGINLFQGLVMDLQNAISMRWDKVTGPFLMVPQVWILE